PFLDVLVNRRSDGALETSVYSKGTHTDQILNYKNIHPNCHKSSCIRTPFRRAETHCSTRDLNENEEKFLFKMFTRNGYPRNFIRRCLLKTKNNTKVPTTKRATLPYVKNISEMTARYFRLHGVLIAHKPTSTLRRLISKPKEKVKTMEQTNVIYKINCCDCDKNYVGQTGRRLSTRIHEHKLAIRRHDPLSLMSIHEDQEGHKFNLDAAEIVARTSTRHGREFMEAWHSTSRSINKHIQLDSIYRLLRAKEEQI
ncbi:hypothetical protein, partial [Cetobacterium sp.]|uniref:hypothetical protein n=1 Tax=Cetobacterium sp. TaxID=2071632 RepID=UPI003EE4BCD4